MSDPDLEARHKEYAKHSKEYFQSHPKAQDLHQSLHTAVRHHDHVHDALDFIHGSTVGSLITSDEYHRMRPFMAQRLKDLGLEEDCGCDGKKGSGKKGKKMKKLDEVLGTVREDHEGYKPNGDSKMRKDAPGAEARFVRKHLDAVVKIKNLVPGVTDNDDLFNAANMKRAFPEGSTDRHGHVPTGVDKKVYEDATLADLTEWNTQQNAPDEKAAAAQSIESEFVNRYGNQSAAHGDQAQVHTHIANHHSSSLGDYDPHLAELHRRASQIHRTLQKLYQELVNSHIKRLKGN